jgi:S-DNA-T family DNA segregation ATPase FtsK/SpoIIIE
MESIYKSYSLDQLQELFSNFLISSWSFSKVSTFARNEKAFEMNYIYGLYNKSSATTIAGQAYHKALQAYFIGKKEGRVIDLVEMETIAQDVINETEPNKWKLSKTMPTMEESKEKAYKTVSALLRNFLSEIATYEEDIQQVLAVELECQDFVTVNGVDIPLPCKAIIDLVVITKAGKKAIIDHKSKQAYTADDELALAIGDQAITYVLVYEAMTGETIDEVWFVENKFSQNKDKGPQLNKYVVTLDQDTRRLYEAKLYEPLKRMIEAVSDPNYVYLINNADNFVDRAELYDFWARTMISEVEDFNVEESKRELVAKRLKKVRDASAASITPSVIKRFKENASKFITYDLSNKDMAQEQKIEHALRTFGIQVQVAHKFYGYSSNTFLLEIGAGVKVGSIYSHRLDIANALDVANVRISPELKVYEDKSYVAIDFAKKREGALYFNPSDLVGLRIPLGKDNFNNTIVWDLGNHSTPHMLICGATGSGKSVCVKSIIEYARVAGIDHIVIFDPKFEFTSYNRMPGISVYNDIEEIELQMMELVEDMQDRVRRGERSITLVIFDEFADAVANSRKGNELKVFEEQVMGYNAQGMPRTKKVHVGDMKSLEENLRILLQKGRSSGFRIVAATQRASVKVITGDAKVNFPVQVCFRVPKEIDSKVVIDEPGAEGLAGMGDGLIKSPEYKETVRFQAYYYDAKQIPAHA